MMKVTIIGSGHGGCAIAAFLAMHGHDVSIGKLGTALHNRNFDVLRKRKKIRLSGIEGEGEFSLANVTNDPSKVVSDAKLVLVYYVSNYHLMVANCLAPFLKDDQIVALGPGYMGSLLFNKALKKYGKVSMPLFAEFETLPFTSRIQEPGSIHISSKNVRHPFAAYPASRASEIVERFEPIIGKCVPRKNLIEVALHNPNLVIHTIGVLMNAPLIEDPHRKFAMYRDGFSPSMWNLVGKLDDEKMDVLEKLGAPRISYFDAFKERTFEDTRISSLKGFMHYASEAPDGPFSLDNRYITEDVPMGLGLLHSLGQALNVRTPICESLINIANAFLPDHNFWAEARTIESIWDGSLEELLEELT